MQDSISLKMLANVVEEVKQNNNTLYVCGVLQTFYKPGAILNNQIKENLNAGIDVLNTKLFETRILDYRYVDDYATYTNSYAAFAEEFLRDIQPKGADYEK